MQIRNLVKMMTVYFSDLKDYGQDVDLDIILTKYRIYFEQEFSTEQVIYAIHRHCERSIEIPRIGNLMDILKPQTPVITEAQFIEAQRWQERNSFPMISDAKETIELYKAQNAKKRQDHKIQSDEIKAIASNAIKKITKS
jgi:hypothetical protein